MVHRALNRIQHRFARSNLAVRAAVYLRNQCNCVIKYHFAPGPDFDQSGERWLLDEVAPRCTTMIDVGANVGDWSAYCLRKGEPQIVAFEPSTSALERLSLLSRNHPNMTVCPIALGDTAGTASFTEELGAGQHSSFIADFAGTTVATRTVTVSTLDIELERLGIEHVDMLKVDCEGYDLHVLRGAADLLKRGAVDIIQFEYNRPWSEAGSTLAAAYTLLQGCGYDVFMLRHAGLYTFNYARYGDFFEYSNFVALSKRVAESLRHRMRGSV